MFNLFSISRFATVARCVFVVALFLSFVISVTRADAQGALYVGDISSNIYKVDPTTKQISVFTTINSFPNFNASLAENEGAGIPQRLSIRRRTLLFSPWIWSFRYLANNPDKFSWESNSVRNLQRWYNKFRSDWDSLRFQRELLCGCPAN